MTRLTLSDSGMDVVVKMPDGNPGAIGALMEVLSKGDEIDPQGFMGGMCSIIILDTWGIYGSDIYILWSDKCNKDTRKMLMIIRATQLGLFSNEKLKEMCADQMRKVDLTQDEWSDLDNKVCEKLTEFQKPI